MRWLVLLVAASLLTGCLAVAREPAASAVVPSAGPSVDAVATDVPPLVDRPAAVVPSLSPRPRELGPKVVVVPVKPNPVRVVHTERLGAGIRGTASWYCGNGSRCTVGHSGGLYAAIRRDLLGHRGDQARVCSGSRCVTVTIIDCNCGLNANLIDLYSDAFSRLAPISRGRIPVMLTWLR